VLARVVDGFVESLYLDPVVRANATTKRELRPTHKAGFKYQLTTLLCQETGGPCKYAGARCASRTETSASRRRNGAR